jgi:hypothetical protein
MAVVFLITDIKPNPQGGFLIPKSPTIRSSRLNLKSRLISASVLWLVASALLCASSGYAKWSTFFHLQR